MDILGEVRFRKKSQVTIPPDVVNILKLTFGDFLRFEINDNVISVHKAITRKVVNNHKKGS